MNSLIGTKNIPPLTLEQIKELEELSKMTNADIDFSDIPKISKEELKKFKPARLRKQKMQLAS